MANRHTTLRSLFHDIAEALRSKYETTDTFTADDFDTAISGLVKPTATKAATTVTLNASTTSTTVAAGTYLSGAFKAQVSLYDWA